MTIRMMEIEESEIDAAVFFHNAEYGTKRTSKQWLWEYKGNYPESSVFLVIKDENRIVGAQGIIPIYLNVKGRKYLSGKSESTLLECKYRGKGLFTRLYDLALSRCRDKGICCVWGYTSVKSALRLFERLGFTFNNNIMCEVILFMDIRKFISSILLSGQNITKKIAKSLLVMLIYLYSRGAACSSFEATSRQFSIEQQPRIPHDILDLYERLRRKYDGLIHIEQDEKYISWRIFNNPNVRYATYFVYEQNLLRAYCYVSLANPEEVYISDLTFEDEEAGDFLLRTVLAVFRRRKACSVAYMGNTKNQLSTIVLASLRKHGFVRFGSQSFVLKNLLSKNEECLDIKHWYLNGLWTEGYTI